MLENLPLVQGPSPADPLDLLLVNAPLRDYATRPRVNDYTLPVLGMAYIATYAAACGYNVAVLDAEAHGLPVADTIALINQVGPRWAGFNLLAPTYEISATIAAALDPGIRIMQAATTPRPCRGGSSPTPVWPAVMRSFSARPRPASSNSSPTIATAPTSRR